MAQSTSIPRAVVDKDHELDGRSDRATEALAKHRWHWTLDESNSKRVSVHAYARAVGIDRRNVQRYAKGYALFQGGDSRVATIHDAVLLAAQSTEQQAFTEAIAEGSGRTIASVASPSDRVRRRDIVERAQDRAERRGTDPVEEARTIAASETRAAKGKKKREREEKQRHSLRYIRIEGSLANAQRHLVKAMQDTEGVPFDSEEAELIKDALNKIRAALNLIDLRMTGNLDVDWDVELAKLTGGER